MSIVYEEDLIRDKDGDLRDRAGNLLEHNGVWLGRNVRMRSRKDNYNIYSWDSAAAAQREEARLNAPGIIERIALMFAGMAKQH